MTGLTQFERRSDGVPVFTESEAVAARVVHWQLRPPQSSLTLVVKASCDILPGEPARLCEQAELPTGELHLDDDLEKSIVYASDFAITKSKADVTVAGHAYAPGGAAKAMKIRCCFGHQGNGFDRSIAVFGPRRWRKSALGRSLSAPAVFEKLPVSYERSFGGAGHAPNPVGCGCSSGDADDGALPNLEDPDQLICAVGDTPPPACFAPLPLAWRHQWFDAGCCDEDWLATRWPYFPDGFDYGLFQAAPRQQQLDFLSGDEPFAIHGMHPQHEVLEGTLPDLRPRAFVVRPQRGGSLEEIALVLDTVHFDLDAMRLQLVWRAVTDVVDKHASDISSLFVLHEGRGEPVLEPAEVEQRYFAALLASGAVSPLEPEQLAGGEPAAANDTQPSEPTAALELNTTISARQAAALELLCAAGLDDRQLASLVQRDVDETKLAREQLLALLDDGAEAPEPDLRLLVKAKLLAGEPLDGADLSEADLSDLDLRGWSLVGVQLVRAKLTGADLSRADLSDAQLCGADLSGCKLDEAVLAGADLSGARLVGASLHGARIDDAVFDGVAGGGADMRQVVGCRASFESAQLEGARFDEAQLARADFSAARLDRAHFDRASLSDVTLFDAHARACSFADALVEGARADGADLQGSSLVRTRAAGSIWEAATLDGCNFEQADLSSASLVKASCVQARLSGATLVEARLDGCRLAGAELRGANLMQADLSDADLSDADLSGSNLYDVESHAAELRGASFEGALLGRARLGAAS